MRPSALLERAGNPGKGRRVTSALPWSAGNGRVSSAAHRRPPPTGQTPSTPSNTRSKPRAQLPPTAPYRPLCRAPTARHKGLTNSSFARHRNVPWPTQPTHPSHSSSLSIRRPCSCGPPEASDPCTCPIFAFLYAFPLARSTPSNGCCCCCGHRCILGQPLVHRRYRRLSPPTITRPCAPRG